MTREDNLLENQLAETILFGLYKNAVQIFSSMLIHSLSSPMYLAKLRNITAGD
jgi:hypothetical protein